MTRKQPIEPCQTSQTKTFLPKKNIDRDIHHRVRILSSLNNVQLGCLISLCNIQFMWSFLFDFVRFFKPLFSIDPTTKNYKQNLSSFLKTILMIKYIVNIFVLFRYSSSRECNSSWLNSTKESLVKSIKYSLENFPKYILDLANRPSRNAFLQHTWLPCIHPLHVCAHTHTQIALFVSKVHKS